MFDINNFTLKDMTIAGAKLRKMGIGASSMEDVASKVVNFFYNNFINSKTNKNNFALVRLFKTHFFETLTDELKNEAKKDLKEKNISPNLKCLTLLSTAGNNLQWQDPKLSKEHRVNPLLNKDAACKFPMISNFIKQCGIKIHNVVNDTNLDLLLDYNQTTFNVFYVENALHSPFIPAQEEFVIPEKIKSCVGFGGMLPSGDVFALILFSKDHISKNTASMFKSLALNVKISLLPFENNVFKQQKNKTKTNEIQLNAVMNVLEQVLDTHETLDQLLNVHEASGIDQSNHIIKTNAELEKKVEEVNLKLVKANEEFKNFAYIVSHDLRAPLRSINQLSEWVIEDYGDNLDEEGKEFLSLLSGRATKMNNLIEGVMQYSRIGRSNEKYQEIDLNNLLKDILIVMALKDNVKINICDNLPTLNADKIRITQLFANLISNAVKYNDKKEVKIDINFKDKNDYFEFAISDNGIGIKEKDFERIFQIFKIVSPDEDDKSTGVGLTIIKKIIEFYQGEIWLRSELGKGTTFYFTFKKKTKNKGDQ